MRSSRSSNQHQEAVSRRLALLGAQLAAVREAGEPRTGAAEGDLPAPPEHTRVQPQPALDGWTLPTPLPQRPELPPDDLRLGRPVPVPGRHAARRGVPATRLTGRAGGEVVGAGLRERLIVGPAQLAVLAMLVLGGLLVTGWWLLRSSPGEPRPVSVGRADPLVTPAALAPSEAGAVGAGEVTTPAANSGATVVVDVEGRVRHPGIVVLQAGSRVVDAVRAAGGARPRVDLSELNLARQLVDGEQILVGVRAPGGVAASAAAPSGASVPVTLVNLNTADQPTLESLPDVGPVTAQAIIAWRQERGGFTAVDQLLDVDGIGEATLGQIAPLVTI